MIVILLVACKVGLLKMCFGKRRLLETCFCKPGLPKTCFLLSVMGTAGSVFFKNRDYRKRLLQTGITETMFLFANRGYRKRVFAKQQKLPKQRRLPKTNTIVKKRVIPQPIQPRSYQSNPIQSNVAILAQALCICSR
jgi:hypothetical protein